MSANKSIDRFAMDSWTHYKSIDLESVLDDIESYDILKAMNIPYEERYSHHVGSYVYYDKDYVSYILQPNYGLNILDVYTAPIRVYNSKYWHPLARNIFMINANVSPSDAIDALFLGPTTLECATATQLAIYMSLRNTYGKKLFNARFESAFSRLYITNAIFSPLISHDVSDINKTAVLGFPLYFLYDNIPPPAQLRKGDLVYIKGVGRYAMKHLSGDASGWNVIFDGKGFVGFGPDVFGHRTVSYEEIKDVLIKGYNADHTPLAKHFQLKFPDRATTIMSLSLAHDKEQDDIDGIVYVLRPNHDRIQSFMLVGPESWFSTPYQKRHRRINKTKIIHISPFSMESRHAKFDNYKVSTADQHNILKNTIKFAYHVTDRARQSPCGFILSGSAGIGKTHMSVSLAKYASNHGTIVAYIDSKMFGSEYQRMAGGDGLDISEIYTHEKCLIIIDDVNSVHGAITNHLIAIFRYVFRTGSAIMISSNVKLGDMSTFIPNVYAYAHQDIVNFIDLHYISASARLPWTDNSIGIDKLPLLRDAPRGGVVIEDQTSINFRDPTRGSMVDRILSKYVPEETENVRIAREPTYFASPDKPNGYVKDVYMHDLTQHTYGIIYVSPDYHNSNEQLINAIQTGYDTNVKLILVTDNIDRLIPYLYEAINNVKNNRMRLMDRFRVYFPGLYKPQQNTP